MNKYLVVYEGIDGDSYPSIFEAFIVSAESASQAKKQVVKELCAGGEDLITYYENHTHAVCVDNEDMYRYKVKREF